MKVYYPDYYKKFKCIAGDCRHSCCIGWEISVDRDTLQSYARLDADLCNYINSETGIIELCESGRCPFLCDDGLCRIISDLGEEYISHICREHPRFYHRVTERVECGIGMSCEEASRVILSSDNYFEFYSVERSDAEWADESDFDAIEYRRIIYSILSDRAISVSERIEKIKSEFSILDSIHTFDEWNEILSELEYLDDEHRQMISLDFFDAREGYELYLERFFAYLIFRHLSIATSLENLRARLGFCLLLLSVFEYNISKIDNDFGKITDVARVISEEIEYSDDNTDTLIFEFESEMM